MFEKCPARLEWCSGRRSPSTGSGVGSKPQHCPLLQKGMKWVLYVMRATYRWRLFLSLVVNWCPGWTVYPEVMSPPLWCLDWQHMPLCLIPSGTQGRRAGASLSPQLQALLGILHCCKTQRGIRLHLGIEGGGLCFVTRIALDSQ